MKLSTIAVLVALVAVWYGFSVISAMMLIVIQANIDNPYVTYGGIVAFVGGLAYLAIRAKPVFDQVTRYKDLLRLVGGFGGKTQ